MSQLAQKTSLSVVEKSGAESQYTGFVPKTFEESMKISSMIANSDLCPKDFKGKPESVFLAIQMGADLGLKPMQAIQNIAVINGRTCIWGDAALAVIKGHPEFQDIEEVITDKIATCTLSRKGRKDVIRTFSIDDANAAGLIARSNVWKQYPKRMLQMRARSFAMRDAFPDALRGIKIAEEVGDYQHIERNVTPYVQQPHEDKNIDTDYFNLSDALNSATNFDDLQALLPDLQSYSGAEVQKNKLRQLYKEKMIAIKEEDEAQEAALNQAMEKNNVDDTLPTE